MSYTPSPRQSQTMATNFGTLRNDGNHKELDHGNVFQTQDAAVSPVTSPITVNTTQTLTVPPNAVSVTLIGVTNAVQVSEDSTMSTYFSLPAGVPWEFDCADQAFIYLKVGSSTAVSTLWKIV
jgi:hypothetical protein